MSTIKSYQDLEIWQLAIGLDKTIQGLTMTEMVSKDIQFREQIIKAAFSIGNYIAEGFKKGGWLDFIQCLNKARSCVSEVQSQLITGLQKELFSKEIFDVLSNQTGNLADRIDAFIKYMNHSEVKKDTANKKQEKRKMIVNTNEAAKPLGAYPHARKVGNLLFLSGIGSRSAKDNSIPGLQLDDKGNIIQYDIEAECHSVFANVKAVLEASGSSWDKIVDVTVFLTNMKTDFPIYNKVYGDYFKDVNACRTTVEVKSLPTPIAIELKVIAMI
jgi:2-aminomuconate deaminase